MPTTCNKCKHRISREDIDNIICGICNTFFYGKCVSVSGNKEFWSCNDCVTKNEKSTLTEILNEIRLLRTEQSEIIKSLNLCHEKIDDCNSSLRKQEAVLCEHLNRIDVLENKTVTLQKENEVLKKEINDLQQYSRINCVELIGVPETPNENVLTTVQAVGVAVNFNITPNMIDTCHRLKINNDTNTSKKIIVKFVRRCDKEEFLQLRKVKRNLKVQDLIGEVGKHIASNNFIYINECLTSFNRQLFSQARKFKNEHNVKFLWTKGGKIFMRAKENSRIYQISNLSDFNDVH
ncbi:hypothetical protein RN001_007303 [Aquatica leii]|uniref:FP protein C-terminal domain-containing protein n=1 Tax=Aquatica leii TaxID=1421715 RepID=A0AAN7PY05_9COLE|nr:hypothetical protein RN001_007303 [Aquatica leii]